MITAASKPITLWAALVALVVPAGIAQAEPPRGWQDFMLVHLYSAHIGDEGRFNDNTPGFAFGATRPVTAWPDWEFGLETGVLWNSYEELSPYSAVHLTRRVAATGPWELHAGGGLALAYYDELSEYYAEAHGLTFPGAMAPLFTLGGVVRHEEGLGLRASVLPQNEVDLVVNVAALWTY